jgi:hypothetical protein
MRRFLLVGSIVAALAGPAEALTIRDIIELTRAGVSEEVLLALIEVDRGVYDVDTATLKQLKAAGVSERVMVALVRSGREAAPVEPPIVATEAAAESPAPQVIVIEHAQPERVVEHVREVPVAVAVPVFVPLSRALRLRHRAHDRTFDASQFVPFQSGPPAVRPTAQPPAEPVYWGWGGKRRPDTWDPPPSHQHVRQPDHRKK